jgi:hypothetical protein
MWLSLEVSLDCQTNVMNVNQWTLVNSHLNRRGWPWNPHLLDILICVQVNILHWWERQGAYSCLAFSHSEMKIIINFLFLNNPQCKHSVHNLMVDIQAKRQMDCEGFNQVTVIYLALAGKN